MADNKNSFVFEDKFSDNFSFEDLDRILRPDRKAFMNNIVNELEGMSQDEFINFAEENNIKLPANLTNNHQFGVNQAFEALNLINEDIDFGEKNLKDRSFKLVKNLRYSSVKDVLDGKEILNYIYPSLDGETLLNYYSRAGFINANDVVFFPAGMTFTFKEYVDYNNEAYFILTPANNPNCLIAISTADVADLFSK